jgi:hypothetical protein
MPKILLRTVCLGVVAGLAMMASATPINITMSLPLGSGSTLVNDVSAQDTPGSGLGDDTVFAWLQQNIATYNANIPGDLPDPTSGLTFWENQAPLVSAAAGDYLVLHYGTGNGGTGQGGGLVALYFGAAEAYQVPAMGSGPNGFGGISFVRLWDHTTVPDGGFTIALLGSALLGVAIVGRRLRRS